MNTELHTMGLMPSAAFSKNRYLHEAVAADFMRSLIWLNAKEYAALIQTVSKTAVFS